MTMTRNDVAATTLTLLAVLAFAAAHQGWGVPLVGDSYRWAGGAVALLGMLACGRGRPGVKGPAARLLAVLGAAALALFVVTLATASLTALSLLTLDVVVLWAAATLRHALAAPNAAAA